MVISNYDVSTLSVVVPFGDGVVYTIGLLFSGTTFPLDFCESV